MKKFSINEPDKNERAAFEVAVDGINFPFMKQKGTTQNCTSLTIYNSFNFLKKVYKGLEFNENIGSLNEIIDKETGRGGKRESVYDFLLKNNFGDFYLKKKQNNDNYFSDINIISSNGHMFPVVKNPETGGFLLLDSQKEPQVISREIRNEQDFCDYLGTPSFVIKKSYRLEKKDFDKSVKFQINEVLDQ